MRLAHSAHGSGPTLLILDQLDPPSYWESVATILGNDHRIVHVTLPGFGGSPRLPVGATPDPPALARAVASWLDERQIKGAFVTGNSLGGAVAIELARLHAVAGVVAISPVGFWTHGEARAALTPLKIGRALARAIARNPAAMTDTRIGRRFGFGQMLAIPDRMTARMARDAVERLATAKGFEATRSALLDWSIEGTAVKVPVTVAWAEKDHITPHVQSKRVRAFVPGAEPVTLPGCGHAAMIDNPRLVARVIREAAERAKQQPLRAVGPTARSRSGS